MQVKVSDFWLLYYNDFTLTLFAFKVRQKFEPFCVNKNRARTHRTRRRLGYGFSFLLHKNWVRN